MTIRNIFFTLLALIGSQSLSAQTRPVIPLEYVSEFSMGHNKQTGAFTTSHRNDSCGWYTPDEAKRLVPKGYHVPTEYEMYVILPQELNTYGTNFENVGWVGKSRTFVNHPEEVQVAGVKAKYTADYIFKKERPSVLYGIRFIGQGNKYRSAYRYERVGNINGLSKGAYGDRKSYLKVQAKYLGNNGTTNLEEIAKEEFWHTSDIITRIIPANGKLDLEWQSGGMTSNPFNSKLGAMISILALSQTPITCNAFETYDGLYFSRFRGARHENYVYGGTAVVRPFLNQLPAQPVYNPDPQVHMTYTASVENRPALPIDYVADFNVGKPAMTFNITEEGADGSKFEAGKWMNTMPQGYHIPTYYEMCGILPNYLHGENEEEGNYEDYVKITVNGKTSTYKEYTLNYFVTTGVFTGYCLKFVDDTNEFLSAYKYEFDRLTYNLKVSYRYLGPNYKGEVHELTYPEFWMTEDVITVQFPMTNGVHGSSKIRDVFGSYCVIDDGMQKAFTVGPHLLGISKAGYFRDAPTVIRPFKNSLKPKAPTKATAKGRSTTQKSMAPRNSRQSTARSVKRK